MLFSFLSFLIVAFSVRDAAKRGTGGRAGKPARGRSLYLFSSSPSLSVSFARSTRDRSRTRDASVPREIRVDVAAESTFDAFMNY